MRFMITIECDSAEQLQDAILQTAAKAQQMYLARKWFASPVDEAVHVASLPPTELQRVE